MRTSSMEPLNQPLSGVSCPETALCPKEDLAVEGVVAVFRDRWQHELADGSGYVDVLDVHGDVGDVKTASKKPSGVRADYQVQVATARSSFRGRIKGPTERALPHSVISVSVYPKLQVFDSYGRSVYPGGSGPGCRAAQSVHTQFDYAALHSLVCSSTGARGPCDYRGTPGTPTRQLTGPHECSSDTSTYGGGG
jgi:hypothetical protein